MRCPKCKLKMSEWVDGNANVVHECLVCDFRIIATPKVNSDLEDEVDGVQERDDDTKRD